MHDVKKKTSALIHQKQLVQRATQRVSKAALIDRVEGNDE